MVNTVSIPEEKDDCFRQKSRISLCFQEKIIDVAYTRICTFYVVILFQFILFVSTTFKYAAIIKKLFCIVIIQRTCTQNSSGNVKVH